jgi:hypothetical protein
MCNRNTCADLIAKGLDGTKLGCTECSTCATEVKCSWWSCGTDHPIDPIPVPIIN